MGVRVEIDGVDRTYAIQMGSLSTEDQVNNAIDTCQFTVEYYPGQTWRPEINKEVEVFVDDEKTYGGVIITSDASLDGESVVLYDVKCKDYTQYMNRELITERYEDTTVEAIVLDLIDRYGDPYGFFPSNVGGASISVASISFSELNLSDALEKLAKLTTYSWYVDENKGIHFFARNNEAAVFNINDNPASPDYGNYILDSININEDLSQIRNKVKVRGGEARAEERTKLLAGNGVTDVFGTEHKFAELPTVLVDGVAQTVGLDYLQADADYDVMWNFGQKYIRFTAGHIPPEPTDPDVTNIEITGIPLKPLIVEVSDNASIAEFGVYEFKKENDTIVTRDEAIQYAQAELQGYADAIRSGSFQTYEPGLRSGQTINIINAQLGISETFLIQSVRFNQISKDVYIYKIEVATLRLISFIDVLQGLLFKERISEGEDETLLNFFTFADAFEMTDSMGAITVTDTSDYVWEQNDPGSDSHPNPIRWNMWTWSA